MKVFGVITAPVSAHQLPRLTQRLRRMSSGALRDACTAHHVPRVAVPSVIARDILWSGRLQRNVTLTSLSNSYTRTYDFVWRRTCR